MKFKYFSIVSFIYLFALTSKAKTIYVDDNASAGGDGTSWASAHKYLQDALALAEYGDEIWVAEGTYKPDQGAGKTAGDRTASFELINGVGMYGGLSGTETARTRTPLGINNQTILSGEIDSNSSLWSLNVVSGANLDANTTLDGFRISGGNANGVGSSYDSGGGLYLENTYLILSNCVFMNNSCRNRGGGIYSSAHSSLTFTNCVFTNNSGYNGGGIYSSAHSFLTFTNCVFANNSAYYGGGINFSEQSSLIIQNSVFTNNSADYGGGINSYLYSSITLTNSILWGNSTGGVDGHGLNVHLLKSFVFQEAIEAEYPGDPNARDAVYEPNLNILQEWDGDTKAFDADTSFVKGWDDDARAFDADPLFVNIESPIGPDGIWFTEDDGLRLQADSPAIDAGYNDALPSDSSDLDSDENITEPIPYDALRRSRVIGSSVDIGPYEFDPDNPPPVVKNLLTLSTTIGGALTGDGYYYKGVTTTIEAVASPGYLFSNWSGDASGSSNPLSFTMDSDKSITANFIQDLNDDDGDGLTNFAEFVTYGTDPSKQDSDNDSILDAKEIEIGSDPKSSDRAVLNYGRTEGRSEGEQSVTSDPESYGLVTKKSYDLLQSKLEECESTKFPWVEFDDFSDSTLDPEKWDLMWWHGAQPPTTSNGMLVLNGNGQLHSPPSRNSPLVQAFIDRELPPGEIPTNHSIAEVKAEGIYGLQAKLMVPNGSAKETGVGMGAVKFYEDGTRHQFEFEIGYWDENNDILSLEFDYRTPGLDQEKVAYYRQGEFDKFYEVSLIHLDGTNFLYFGEELIFEFNATWTPNFFHFFAFNDQDPDRKSFKTYVKDVKVLVPGTPNPVPTTPYTPAWFYVPNQGWMWTNRSAYPYFYNATDKDWMYFQSGNDKPKFYRYKTKTWLTVE